MGKQHVRKTRTRELDDDDDDDVLMRISYFTIIAHEQRHLNSATVR